MCYCGAVDFKACKVTIPDESGIRHTVEVTAASLYEAIAIAVSQIWKSQWKDFLANEGPIIVTTQNVPVNHCVDAKKFWDWTEGRGGAPRDVTRRRRIREILGMRLE
jgi:hypothetical protein